MRKKLYYITAQIDNIQMMIAHTDKGLAFVDNLLLTKEELQDKFPNYELIKDDTGNQTYILALQEYFSGRRKQFSFPLDLIGTSFQREVWLALQKIPFGSTRSYKEIAAQIRRPKAVRAVGGAISKNPIIIIVPCHRVIGTNGKLTGFRGGLNMKQKLLRIEDEATILQELSGI